MISCWEGMQVVLYEKEISVEKRGKEWIWSEILQIAQSEKLKARTWCAKLKGWLELRATQRYILVSFKVTTEYKLTFFSVLFLRNLSFIACSNRCLFLKFKLQTKQTSVIQCKNASWKNRIVFSVYVKIFLLNTIVSSIREFSSYLL